MAPCLATKPIITEWSSRDLHFLALVRRSASPVGRRCPSSATACRRRHTTVIKLCIRTKTWGNSRCTVKSRATAHRSPWIMPPANSGIHINWQSMPENRGQTGTGTISATVRAIQHHPVAEKVEIGHANQLAKLLWRGFSQLTLNRC